MIRGSFYGLLIYVMAAFFGLACSHGSQPVTPSEIPQPVEAAAAPDSAGHHLWYYAMVHVDPDTMEIEMIPSRLAADHWNVLKWLEQGPCTDCVALTGAQKLLNNNILVSVQITHPFASLNLTGFDVRGIAMFRGSQTFPIAQLKTSSVLLNEAELVNADGFTSLYNYTTVGEGPSGLQGYIQGAMAAGLPDSTVNGYKTYITDDGFNLRNYYLGGTVITSDFEIHMPPKPFIMGYAVDASWAPPTNKPVSNANTDFPDEANCPEPWKIVVTENPSDNSMTDQGGSDTLTIDVYDWQGKDSHHAPAVECPDLFTGLIPATWVEDGIGYSRWTVTFPNSNMAGAGQYNALIAVEDNDNATSPDYLDLTAYQIQTLLVTPDSALHGWGLAFGGLNADAILDTVTDGDGNIYITGFFTGTADFDPGPGEANLSAHFLQDAFVAKYDKSGNYLWAGNWGGEEAKGVSIALNGDSVVVFGDFLDLDVDFDPGAGEDIHDSLGLTDLFINVFEMETGNQEWSVTWGGYYEHEAGGMAIDALGRIFVAGSFRGVTDFDPGPGNVEKNSLGSQDCFLQRMDGYGNHQWVKTWGGTSYESVHGLSVSPSGESWVAGQFQYTVDFDPGDGVDEHTAVNNYADAFVSRFDPDGNLQWARTWGGTGTETANSVVQDQLGYSWIVGNFEATADFDPGAGTAELTSWGFTDGFVLKLNPNGGYLWSGQMGGTDNDHADSVALDPLGNVYICGDYSDNSDLDPGPGHANFSSESDADPYLIKLSSVPEFIWGDVWGGDTALCVYVDDYARSYVGGQFYGSADLDPGPGVDEHTGSGTTASLNVIPASGLW